MTDRTILKKIKTSCQFPMLKYDVRVRYNEVKKASGIAYILLELLQKSVMKNERIVEVLLRFGIPTDLQYIFAKELSALVANKIVKASFDASYIEKPNFFEQMELGEFSLTAKGRKMFAEGAIPTGQEKVKAATVFYSPVTRKFELTCTLSYSPLETSFLGESFLDDVQYDVSGMEDYIKSVQIKIGLKSEEMVVGIEYEAPKKLAVKQEENLTIDLTDRGVNFSFDTSDEKVFFEKYYSSLLMSKAMLAKEKYKFPYVVPTVRWETVSVNAVYIPADAVKQAARPCRIFLSRGKLEFQRADNVLTFDERDSAALLDLLDNYAEFALLDSKECRYYAPLNIQFPCENFGDVFEMQTLAETIANKESIANVLLKMYEICLETEYTLRTGQLIVYIATFLDDAAYLQDYAVKKLIQTESDEERIELLLKLNASFIKCAAWKPIFDVIAEEIFARYVKTIALENVIFKNTLLSPLRTEMQMSDEKYIRRFSAPLKANNSDEIVYQALESAGFGEIEILSVANVVDRYAKQLIERMPIDGTTVIAKKFSLLSINLWKLCDMLGVENPTAYTLKDDFNVDAFFDTYATFEKAYKSVKEYKLYSKENFESFARFAEIFEPVQNILAAERTAALHPEKITRQFIDEQIARGHFSVAISNLLIKAQYNLRKMLAADNSIQANELIEDAEKSGIIDKETAKGLHKLRMCRNSLQHPEKRQIQVDNTSVKKWENMVFSLKGVKI